MLRTPTIGSIAVATALLGAALSLPAPAQARGRHGGGYVGVRYGGFYGWGPGPYMGWGAPYWGWGWGPGPYNYNHGLGTQQALLGYAMVSGMGGLELDAKPNRAEVWVDGKYVADARDLDGYPSYLWLKQGAHHVVLYKAGYKSVDVEVDVRPGVLQPLKVQLEKGDSQPPVRSAAEPRPAEPRVEIADPRKQGSEPRVEATARQGDPLGEVTVPQGDPHGEVGLRVEPRDATVYVDGKFVGLVRDLGVLRLAPGHHRVDLARPGYRELTKEIDVEVGRRSEIVLSMERGGGGKL